MKRRREINTYNLSIQERRALQRLKEDVSIIILPSDKGCSTVVMNKSDYKDKINDLLSIKEYSQLPSDPTLKVQDKISGGSSLWQGGVAPSHPQFSQDLRT